MDHVTNELFERDNFTKKFKENDHLIVNFIVIFYNSFVKFHC